MINELSLDYCINTAVKKFITVFFVTVLVFRGKCVSILISICLDGDGLWDGGLGQRGLHQRLIQKLLKLLLVQLTSGCCHTGQLVNLNQERKTTP